MNEIMRAIIDQTVQEFKTGCGAFTRQLDIGTGKTQDLCSMDREKCPFFDGWYQAHGDMEPEYPYDLPIGQGTHIGFCRLQKDTVKIGPIVLLDRQLLRKLQEK